MSNYPPWGTSLSNQSNLLVFFDIHEYTNEIIFILDHWANGLVKLYNL